LRKIGSVKESPDASAEKPSTEAHDMRMRAQRRAGEAKQLVLKIADDYFSLARSVFKMHAVSQSISWLRNSHWTAPKNPTRCPAKCSARAPVQRAASEADKTELGIPAAARAWICSKCNCVYTLEPLGLPRFWIR